MAVFKPFRAIRPSADHVKAVASRPYDVLNSNEARQEAEGNDLSFLHVVKPEIDLPVDTDPYSDAVYDKGKVNFQDLISRGILNQDPDSSFYIYRLTMDGRSQTGLVGCCFFEEYFDGIIKKHELTRPVKENDRVRHVECLNANAEPVFFSYRGKSSINEFVRRKTTETPEYNFIADDQIKHELWLISNTEDTKFITDAFKEVPYLYVADGHHRTAAAARIGKKRKEENPNHTGKEEYNYFLTVLFPDDELKIFDYNRLVKDLNGLSPSDFLTKLEDSFIVSQYSEGDPQPTIIREFSLYMEGQWYRLLAKDGCWDENDPVGDLDVTILSEKVLTPLLNIVDLRKDNRIDFVGGIRGLRELKRRVDSGEMVAAFALYPVTMEQLLSIADAGEIMPPKTTWFEPKLRSGLFVHDLE
jgi:uncharacterized protein (DUF1015 family)